MLWRKGEKKRGKEIIVNYLIFFQNQTYRKRKLKFTVFCKNVYFQI